MLSFTQFLESREETLTADEIIDYISSITPVDSDVPDYFFKLVKKSGKNFKKQRVSIESLLKNDSGLREYVESVEERYGPEGESEIEPHPEEIENPVVVFNGEVIDGYSRISTKYRSGETHVDAYVSM